MKRFLLIACVGWVSFLVGCGDSDPEPTEKDFLQNNWLLDSYIYLNLPPEVSYWGDSEFTTVYGETMYDLDFTSSNYTRGVTFNLTAGGDTTISESGEYSFADGELILDPTGSGLGTKLSNAFGVALPEEPNIFNVETITESDLIIVTEVTDFLTTNAWRDYSSENFSTQEELDEYINGLTEVQLDSLNNAAFLRVTFDVSYDFDLNPN